MKKLYTTQTACDLNFSRSHERTSFFKVVSLSTAVVLFLSNVSPVFSAKLDLTKVSLESVKNAAVVYPQTILFPYPDDNSGMGDYNSVINVLTVDGNSIRRDAQNIFTAGIVVVSNSKKDKKTKNAVVLNPKTYTTKKKSAAIGFMARALGLSKSAIDSEYNHQDDIGEYTFVNDDSPRARAKGNADIAIETKPETRAYKNVILGDGSATKTPAGVYGYSSLRKGPTNNDNFVWKSTAPAATVGDASNGLTRQIQGVAAGSKFSDAANVGQLKALETYVDQGWKLSVGGENATTVGIKNVVDLSTESNNLKITKGKDNNNVKFDLAENIKVKSVTAGNTFMDEAGYGFVGDKGPKITMGGIDLRDKKIKRVANGTADDEAVNLSQLKEIKNEIVGDSLVKWDEDQKLITIGKEKDGTKIDIANKSGDARKISGVEEGGLYQGSTEAVNGSQLWDTNETVKHIDKRVTNISDTIADMGEQIDDLSQDALLWNKEEGAFSARHEKDGRKTDSKITGLLDGDVTKDSTDAINGSQLYTMGDKIADYFGGVAHYENGKWVKGPEFKVTKRGENGDLVEGTYFNVTDAFKGVDNSITDIYNQINNVTENSLVKQEGENDLITVGQETGGTKISIANKNNQERTILGVKAAELSSTSTEAVNGSQLFATDERVANVTGDLSKVAQNTSKYFGGNTDVLNGVEPAFLIDGNSYHNVTDAFTGVDVSIHNIDNKISNLEKNNLVQQEGGVSGIITIGKDTAGTEINIAGYASAGRTISGVRAAEKGDEAVNKDQLDKSIEKISKDIETASIAAVLYDKNEDGTVNYKSVTLGGSDNQAPVALHNVQAGIIAEESHDAINGSQINKISGDIANYFGGEAKFIDGAFKGPKYTLSVITEDGTVGNANYRDVGSALTGLDANVKSVNNRITNVANNFNQKIEGISKDALLWDDEEQAFVARHEKNGRKTDSKITSLLDGDITEESTDAINGSQINKISKDIANFFGGGTEFNNGVFSGPQYNLSKVSADGNVEQKAFDNVGSALTGLDANVKNVNSRLTYVDNKFDKFSQDALLWDDGKGAFSALHEKEGSKTNSKITFLADGDISEDSTDAINGSQLYAMGYKIANYFGGGARYENGEWGEPTFKISQRNKDGTIVEKKHHNVADAFEGVDNSITDIYNQINNVTENSLVKQEGEDGPITIGAKTGGNVIDIANNKDEARTISGIKDGQLSLDSKEAVNGSQLFAINQNVTTNLSRVAQNTSAYFGGSTDVIEGIKPTFVIDGETYRNVTDAFTGVNISIHKIDNKISDLEKNNLVKQEGGVSAPITIGKDTAGTEINIAGYGGSGRKISGVRAAEKGDEAVNKDQLDKSIEKISKDIETASAAAVLYDKDEDGIVNYGSVTLGGDKNKIPVALLNVKNGKIAENSHDAINGSQINKISGDIANYFGGDAKFIDGAFKGPKYTLSVITEDGTVAKANYRDVGSALTGLDANVKSVNNRITNVANNFNEKIEDISKDALLWDDEEQAFVARHEKDGKKTNSKLKYLVDGDISADSTDAINGSQLYSISNQLAAYFGGGAKYENGKWTNPQFKIVQVNADGTTVEKNHGNVADAFGDVNKNMSNINNRINDVINKVDSDALKWNNDKKAYDATHDGTPSKIINVADGKIAKDSKDAVNGGQLWKTNERVANVENRVTDVENHVEIIDKKVDNISNTIADIGDIVNNIDTKVDKIDDKVNNIAEDAVRYDRDASGKKTNKITLKGSDPSEPVMIDNVADGRIGTGSKEAVNGGQLHDYTKEQMKIVLDESKRYTDQRVNNIVINAIDDAVDKSKQYTDMKFNILTYDIKNVRKEARQAAAIGLAVSNLRYFDDPGSLSVSFGSGTWRGQSAFALGAGYTSENGKIRSNLSATSAGGHWGVGGAITLKIK